MIVWTLPLALTALAFPQADSEEGLARLEMESVDFPLRDGSSITAERGMLTVPILRSKPDSKEIQVEVWRFFREEGALPETPPVFQLHGGPGWGGLDPAPGVYEDEIQSMAGVTDVVVVGQRGIGNSVPNTVCENRIERPSDAELTPEEEVAAIRNACGNCRAHWEAQGYDLTGFNVIEAAGDVADVRRTLGYDKITLSGGSFGSHWGMTIMRLHPEIVARAILTGMEGPNHTYDMPSGVLASLERVAGEAELSEALLPHLPKDGILGAFKAVIADVEAEPLEIEVTHPNTGRPETVVFDGDAVRDLVFGYTARVNSRRTVGGWPADLLALYQGDFELAAQTRLQRGGGRTNLPTASYFMLDCGSGITRERLKELQDDPAAKVVGDLGAWYEAACPAWGSDLGDDFRSDFVTDVPTVIVHGTWDVSTPFDNALELLDFFENGHFVIVDGGTHGALGEALEYSAEFRDGLMRFLGTGEVDGLPEEVRMPPIVWTAPR